MTREPHSNTSATFPAASNCATVLLTVNHLGLCGTQDFAVRHHDDAIGCSGKIPVMGDHEHGAAIVACELHQDSLYVGADDSIEIAGGLIGQNQQWVVG